MDTAEPWERWCGSTAEPLRCLKRRAKVDIRGGVKWITYPDTIKGVDVIVEMPLDAATKSCDNGRHDHCPHRLGGDQEGGVLLKLSRPCGLWRCGCPCHNDPQRAGRLF